MDTGYLVHELGRRLATYAPFDSLLVAYSGGMDSEVLLNVVARARDNGARYSARAVHVHHGVLPEADAWARHCEASCRALGIPLEVVRVDAAPATGESPEDAARRARYRALEARVGAHELVLTAHHSDDQAETLLLQLMRGSGPHGLAAMPESRVLGRGRLVRPLLALSRAALAAFADRAELQWVEDPSNRHLHLPRNFLRHEVLPVMRRAWPGLDQTLGRAARLQAAAAHILDEVAAADRESARGSPPHTLVLSRLRHLDGHRLHSLLRFTVRALGLPAPSAVHLDQIVAKLLTSAADRNPVVTWPEAEVRRYGGSLWFMAPLAARDPRPEILWNPEQPLVLAHGRLEATLERGAGIGVSSVAGRGISVCWRRGGERCRPQDRSHGQTLKRLFQERGVPPWLRDRLPLVYVDDQLAAVADLWVCAPFAAAADGLGYRLRWIESNHPSSARTNGS